MLVMLADSVTAPIWNVLKSSASVPVDCVSTTSLVYGMFAATSSLAVPARYCAVVASVADKISPNANPVQVGGVPPWSRVDEVAQDSDVGAAPAPPPSTIWLAPMTPEDVMAVALEKYGMPPLVAD